MYATYVIKTNARSVSTRFTVGGSITDYIDDPAKGPPGELSKKNKVPKNKNRIRTKIISSEKKT